MQLNGSYQIHKSCSGGILGWNKDGLFQVRHVFWWHYSQTCVSLLVSGWLCTCVQSRVAVVTQWRILTSNLMKHGKDIWVGIRNEKNGKLPWFAQAKKDITKQSTQRPSELPALTVASRFQWIWQMCFSERVQATPQVLAKNDTCSPKIARATCSPTPGTQIKISLVVQTLAIILYNLLFLLLIKVFLPQCITQVLKAQYGVVRLTRTLQLKRTPTIASNGSPIVPCLFFVRWETAAFFQQEIVAL